jgi:hypothetical protein
MRRIIGDGRNCVEGNVSLAAPTDYLCEAGFAAAERPRRASSLRRFSA